MAARYLGIDLGTSAVKAVLVDAGRRTLAEAEAPLATARPAPDRSEQAPEDWWRATEAAVAALAGRAGGGLGPVAAIGLSGQMHGSVILGADDRPLGPVMLWNDGRARAEAAELWRDAPALADRLGVKPMAGLTAPKLLWLARHDPARFARIRTLLLPKDYLRLRLTGERITDPSDAAGTWLLDQAARAWSADAARLVGLDAAALPALVESTAPAGRLRPEVAAAWGLAPGIPVAGGAGDAAAGAVGIGAVEDGVAFVSLGTSGQVLAATAGYRPNAGAMVHAFCHAAPGRWYQMGAILNGASALAWAARLLGTDPASLQAEVARGFAGPGRLAFLPYLTGERTPHDDPAARGVLFGLDAASDARAVGQAVMEGVAFALADARDALRAAGTDPARFAFVGGGARSRVWARIVAAALGRPLAIVGGADKGPAFGAAALARAAATGEPIGTVAPMPPVEAIVEPEPDLAAGYAEPLERYRRLYRALRGEFAAGA